MNEAQCLAGTRVIFTSPCHTDMNEPGVITHKYAFGMIEVDLDNGHHWLAQPIHVRLPFSELNLD